MKKESSNRFTVLDGGNQTRIGPIFKRHEVIRCASCGNTESFKGYVIHSPMNILIHRIPGEKDLYDVAEVNYYSGPDTIEMPTHCAVCGSNKIEFIAADGVIGNDEEY